MVEYTNTLFEQHIPDGQNEERLLVETPVLANLDKVKQTDDFIVSILGKTNQCIANDTNLEKFKNKLLKVLDPL